LTSKRTPSAFTKKWPGTYLGEARAATVGEGATVAVEARTAAVEMRTAAVDASGLTVEGGSQCGGE
jgi:hypothetical protein